MCSLRVFSGIISCFELRQGPTRKPHPNELHAALRQMSLGKAAGEEEVTAELLKFGGDNLWEVVVRVCREQ